MDGIDVSSLLNEDSDAYSQGPPHAHGGSSDSESFDTLTPALQMRRDGEDPRAFPGICSFASPFRHY